MCFRFEEWGLLKGWGDRADRVRETLHCLSEVLQAPDIVNIEKLFGRLPSIFNVVIFSPHGYFGQADVLGLPDTGGQVSEWYLPAEAGAIAAMFIRPCGLCSSTGGVHTGSSPSIGGGTPPQNQAAGVDC